MVDMIHIKWINSEKTRFSTDSIFKKETNRQSPLVNEQNL